MQQEADQQRRSIARTAVLATTLVLALLVTVSCQLDKLLNPSTGSRIDVSPAAIEDSAAVGSAALRVTKGLISTTGSATISWSAGLAHAASWLTLGATGGTTPDSVSISFDPKGLTVGLYTDSVIVKSSAAADSIPVAVRFRIHPCMVDTVAADTTLSDSLTTSDCGAPHRAGRFAGLFAVHSPGGDSVSVTLRSTAFAPYVVVDSSNAAGVAPLSETAKCGGDTTRACITYQLLPDSGTYYVEVTSADSGGTGAFTLELAPPRPPNAPAAPQQFVRDSTPIAVGDTVASDTIAVRAEVSDPDSGDALRLEVELRTLATAFNGTPNYTGTPVGNGQAATVVVPDLADDSAYHWQARVRDQTGRASNWVAFGGNAESAADLRVAVPQPPNDPTGLAQFKTDGTTAIAAGQTTDEASVVFKATVTDPDPGDSLRLEIEVQPLGTAFTGTASGSSVPVGRGATAVTTVGSLSDNTSYHWQARTRDETGRTSAWVPFGTGSSADFNVDVPKPPAAPANLEQLQKDSATVIATGGTSVDGLVVFAAKLSDPDPGDSVRLQAEWRPVGTTFTNVATDSTALVANGSKAFLAVGPLNDDTDYHWQARAVDKEGHTSAWVSYGKNAETAADFHVAIPQPPNSPGSLGQFLPDGTTAIQVGDSIDFNTVVLRAALSDPDPTDSVELEVEVQPIGTSFTNSPTNTSARAANGATVSLSVGGLANGQSYHWQARTADNTGRTSAWVSFGNNADSADFKVLVPHPPNTPTNLQQLRADGTTAIATGATTPENTVVFRAGVTDPDAGDSVHLEVEVRPISTAFSGTPSVVGQEVAGGGTASATVTGLNDDTDYHWQVRGVDRRGNTSAWVSYGGNAESATDFHVAVPATMLAFSVQPTTVAVGVSISPAVTVEAREASGTVDTMYTGTVAIAIAPGTGGSGANLSGASSVAAVKGVATFSSLSIDVASNGYQLSTTSGTLTGATSNSFDVLSGSASQLAFTGQPRDTVAGQPLGPTLVVTVQDQYGNTATSFGGDVTLAITSGTGTAGATLLGSTTATAVNGVATFGGLHIDVAGAGYTLRATATGVLPGTSASFAIRPGSAMALVVGGVADPIVAGARASPTVTAHDAFGNVATGYTGTIHFTTTDGAASVPPNYTFTAGDLGTHSFPSGVVLRTVGEQALTATDQATSSVTGSQSAITVQPAPAVLLNVSGISDPIIAGTSANVIVTARDSLGNVAAGYSGTIHFTSNDGNATLPGDYTFLGGDQGTRTFAGVILRSVGEREVTATDVANGSITGTQSAITVQPATATSFVVSGIADPTTAGASTSVTVTVRDALNNVATGYTGTIHFTSTDGTAVLPADYTFVPGDNGVHTFTNGVRLRIVGEQSVTATDVATSSITGVQTAITVQPAPAAALNVTGISDPITAGSTSNVTVTARDSIGNVATGYRGTIQFTSSDGTAVLPANYTFVSGDNGNHTFTSGVRLRIVGEQTVTATDNVTSSITGTQTAITVVPAPADTLLFTQQPTNTAAGSIVTPAPVVTAHDSIGNVATGFTGTVTVAIASGTGTSGAHLTGTLGVAAQAGVATFGALTIDSVGTGYRLSATATGPSATTSHLFDITTGAANHLAFTVQPATTTAGATISAPGGIQVSVRDAQGNLVTTFSGSVTISIVGGTGAPGASLGGTVTQPVSSGVATFDDLFIQSVGTGYQLNALSLSTTGATSGAFDITPAGATSLSVTGIPDPTTAGAVASVTVTALDQFGNVATGYRGAIAFSSSDGTAVLPGSYTFVAGDNGTHTFTNAVRLRSTGEQTVTTTDQATSSITGSQTAITVQPAPPIALTVSGITDPITAGAFSSVTVTARDSLNNVATSYTGTIHFTSTDGTATLPADYAFVGGDQGTHTFASSVRLRSVGEQTVTATDVNDATITGTQTAITVQPAPAASLTVTGINDPITAGGSSSVTVTAHDSIGNVATGYRGTIHFTSSDPNPVLPADYAFVAGDNGVHTFTNGVRLRTVGEQTVTATDNATSTVTGSQTAITVQPAPAATLGVTGIIDPITAGATASVTVTAEDSLGNVATGYLGTVHFTSSDGTAVLPANYTFVAGDNGVHVFTGQVRMRITGEQTVTATDNVTSSITGTQTAITVQAAPVNSLALTGIADPTTAGASTSATVTARDSIGNLATGYTGTIAFSSTDGTAILPVDYTFVAGDAGVHTFTNGIRLRTVGEQSVTVNDGTRTATQSAITVQPASAATLGVTGIADPITAGGSSNVTVTALDSIGNVATGYVGTIHFTSSDGTAVLPADYTFVGGDNGVHTFTNEVRLRLVGDQTVTATDNTTSSITGTQTAITVQPAPAVTLSVTGISDPISAGATSNVVVTARDSIGNMATGYRGTIHFTSSDGAAVLPADYTFVAGDNGAHTFANGVQLGTPGEQSVTATDGGNSSITGSQTAITVQAAGARSLTVTGISDPVIAGAASSVTVTARDSLGNVATGYVGTIHFTSSDGTAVLPADYTFVSADNGVHTFANGVRMRTVGEQTVTAADNVTSTITGSQTAITVQPAPAGTLVVAGISDPITAGGTSNVTVTARDSIGNVAAGYLGTIHFTSSDGTAVLPADYAFVGGDNGVHTFTSGVRLRTAGEQTVTATDNTTSSITGTQSAITVSPAPADTLLFTQQPTNTVAGGIVTPAPVVTVHDSIGNVATGFTGTVTVAIASGTGKVGAHLTGTLGVAAQAGVATFGTLSIDSVGTGYRLSATATGPSGTTSNLFDITAGAANHLTFSAPPTNTTAGATINASGGVQVSVRDAQGNLVTTFSGSITLGIAAGTGAPGASLGGTVTQPVSSGVATFGNLFIQTAGTGYQLNAFSIPTTTAATSGSFDITPAGATSLSVTGISDPITAGGSSDVTVTALDDYDNVATGYRGTVHFTSTDGTAVLPADYAFVAGDNGVHTFTNGVRLRTPGEQTVTATDNATGSITGSQTAITVEPAPAATLTVAGITDPITAGASASVMVTALDSIGNVATGYVGRIHFTSSDGTAVLPGDYTFVGGDNGVHTFTNEVRLRLVGEQTVTATDNTTSSITGTQGAITVQPAPAATLSVAGITDPFTAGGSSDVTVTALDSIGNVAAGYLGTIHFTSSDGTAVLPADYTFVGGDNGAHTFTSGVRLRTPGEQSVTATDGGTSSITGSQTAITVQAAPAATLTVAGITDPITAGSSSDVTVTALDSIGNVATSYRGTIHFTSSDGAAVLPVDYTFVAGDNGAHTFTNGVQLETQGEQSVTATDGGNSSITGSQTAITVEAGVTATLSVTGISDPITAGGSSDVTVTARDGGGNVVTGYLGTIHFTSSDGTAVVPGDYTFVGGDNGVHTFTSGVRLRTAGEQTVTATDNTTSSITGTQSAITVEPAPAVGLTVAGIADPITAGASADVTVTAFDSIGNVATGYRGTIHFTSSDGTAVLPADYTFVGGDNGAHTFTSGVRLRTPGQQSVTATDGGTSSITGSQTAITVDPAPAATLTVAGITDPITAGASASVTVTALDSIGNVVTDYAGTIHFTSSDGTAVLPADYTFVPADNGMHTFTNGVRLRAAGEQTVTATDGAASITGSQTAITVQPASAAALDVSGISDPITAGGSSDVTVTALDSIGNVATGYLGTIHFTSSDGTAVLPADYTFLAGDNGAHTFTSGVRLRIAGEQTVTATDDPNSSITGTQSAITVQAAPADTLRATSSLTLGGTVGGTASPAPTVIVVDSLGNPVPSASVSFVPSAGSVSPTSPVTTDANGQATVTWTLGTTAGSQTLTVSSGTLQGSPLTFTATASAGAAASLTLTIAARVTNGTPTDITVTALDQFNNIATDYAGTIHFSSDDTAASLPPNYTFAPGDSGVKLFAGGVTMNTNGSHSITVTDTVDSALVVSDTVTVNP